MNLVEYKNMAVQRLNKTIFDNATESMYYGCMGLIEETGEIIAELRKPLFKGNFHEKELDSQNIKSELGDLMWYLALMCENCNVNIEQLEETKISIDQAEEKLPVRERVIQTSINMGQVTGEIVREALKLHRGNGEKSELVKKMTVQYINIKELASFFEITIEQILDENIKKINSRYNEKGDVNR